MLRSVLVASDLGEASESAIRTGAELARLTGARLHLLHVAAEGIADGEARLREHARRAAPEESEAATARVMVGSPGTAIAEHAARVVADVIVLGQHRASSRSAAFGTTATEVVDLAACPCLVVVGVLPLPLDRVIAPADLSEATRGSLAVALTWASALRRPDSDAELTVLHVRMDPEGRTNSEGQDTAAELHREVAQVRAQAGSAARVQVRELLTSSADPASEILRRAASDAADLLVMGTGTTAAGRDSAERRIGRVSAAVVRATPRPVLLVPPPVWRSRRAD